MTRKILIPLFFLGVLLNLGVALFETTPGYMDSEYYFAGGLQLVEKKGFSEPFIWNYLDNPAGIPHPSHLYWMPLPSILAAAGMWITGATSFLAARVLFILLAGLIPVVTASLAFHLTHQKSYALLSGLLAAFSGFYLLYQSNTESFSLYMVLGGVFILLLGDLTVKARRWKFPLIGITSGLLYLSRADGLIWLLAAILWVLVSEFKRPPGNTPDIKITAVHLFELLAAFLLTTGGWYFRNEALFGAPVPPSNAKALWFTQYNDLYLYPADSINFSNWMQSGWKSILFDRLQAAWNNLKTIFAVEGEIFLFPLILAGLWGLRKEKRVQVGVGIWAVTYLVMSLLFPFAGSRGGMMHSGAGVQTLLWAVVPAGLERISNWVGRWRNWDVRQAVQVLGGGLVVISLGLSGFLFQTRVIGPDILHPAWSESFERYIKMEETLNKIGVDKGVTVMVNNPPGFYLASQRPCIAAPAGSFETVVAAAEKYQAKFLMIEKDTTPTLLYFYTNPIDFDRIKYITAGKDFRVYEFK